MPVDRCSAWGFDEPEEESGIFRSLPRKAKVLWIAASGGHIAEAVSLDRLLESTDDSLWVTFDTPQTRSLLDGRRVEFVNYVAPRDLRASVKAARQIRKLVARESFAACVSTGSAVAGVSVPVVALGGLQCYYVESLTRVHGPSLTGRIMSVSPRVATLTQEDRWSSRSWRFEGSILDGMRTVSADAPDGPRRVLVTLGTIRPYRFDRAVDAVLDALRPDDDVVWQLGATSGLTGLPGAAYSDLSFTELSHLTEQADVVISHAGVGSVLMAHQYGKLPVLATRSARYHEHVDEHQSQLAESFVGRGLALALDMAGGKANRAQLDLAAASRICSAPTERTQHV